MSQDLRGMFFPRLHFPQDHRTIKVRLSLYLQHFRSFFTFCLKNILALLFLITHCRMHYLTIPFLERRLTTTTSIKLPSPAPISISHQSASHSRSRLSRQSHTTRAQIQEEEDLDADAEGEDDVAEEDGEEDLTLYCFCHKQSYGDVSEFLPHLTWDRISTSSHVDDPYSLRQTAL